MRRPAPTLPVAVLALLALACVVAPALTAAGVHSPLRVAAALALFILAPGAALLPWVSRRESGAEPALLIAVSLAVSLVVTQGMLWAGEWATVGAACALGGACLVSLVAQIVLRAEDWT